MQLCCWGLFLKNVVNNWLKVTRVWTEMTTPYSIEYVMDRANVEHFAVAQDRHIGPSRDFFQSFYIKEISHQKPAKNVYAP